MKRARAVIGSGFGDEGKGLITDYLCAIDGAGIVVRFNGGSQAGHTVVTHAGQRHVFSHFGSGSFVNIPTYLSHFFVANPILFFQELEKLNALGLSPIVYAHPNCLVTTFADMIINQRIEDKRAGGRHGSVGLGFGETIERSTSLPHLKITMSDLWNNINLEARLVEICNTYAEFRTGSIIPDAGNMIVDFMKACTLLAEAIHPLGIADVASLDPVFEGAQGLLLDQDNKEYFPHVTRSNTGMKNVRTLCAQAGIDQIIPYYVSRTYLTRHGAGPLPGEDASMSFEDNTNIPHNYQGQLRFAPLDYNQLIQRCQKDYPEGEFKLVLTHCDQLAPTGEAHLYSYGPTRNDVKIT